MSAYLLDANVVIALAATDHEHHDRAERWLASANRFAVCPVVEGALVRFLARSGESVQVARRILEGYHTHPRGEFWPDSLSYRTVDLAHVHGHRQVTDAYLASLAEAHDARLATFDTGLAAARPSVVVLIPE